MVIFGGSDQSSPAFNTVHTFDLNLEVWRLAIPVTEGTGGSVPSARKGHTAVCLNNTMIVYGAYSIHVLGSLSFFVWYNYITLHPASRIFLIHSSGDNALGSATCIHLTLASFLRANPHAVPTH